MEFVSVRLFDGNRDPTLLQDARAGAGRAGGCWGRFLEIPVIRSILLVLVLSLPSVLLGSATSTQTSRPPLARWDVLRETRYTPKHGIHWPPDVASLDSTEVRLEGYLIMKFGSQDPSDLLLTQFHPSSLLCGPTDMTAFVEVYLPDFHPDTWPVLPVEVTGFFTLSPHPENMQYIYRLTGDGYRELHRWEQDFPGALEEPEEGEMPDRP